MTFVVTHDGWLDYDGFVKAGDTYTATEEDGYFVIHRPRLTTNIVTSREDALKLGYIKEERKTDMYHHTTIGNNTPDEIGRNIDNLRGVLTSYSLSHDPAFLDRIIESCGNLITAVESAKRVTR